MFRSGSNVINNNHFNPFPTRNYILNIFRSIFTINGYFQISIFSKINFVDSTFQIFIILSVNSCFEKKD